MKMDNFQRRADKLVLSLWINVKWRRLVYCPASCHDLPKLELSGTWELWHPTSPRNGDVLICINTPFLTTTRFKAVIAMNLSELCS